MSEKFEPLSIGEKEEALFQISEIKSQQRYSITDWNLDHFLSLKYWRKYPFFWQAIDPAERNGFHFCALDWVSSEFLPDKSEIPYYRIIVEGTAYWDGVRHLYFISEGLGKGYDYYPDLFVYSAIFERLRQLELEFCSLDEVSDR